MSYYRKNDKSKPQQMLIPPMFAPNIVYPIQQTLRNKPNGRQRQKYYFNDMEEKDKAFKKKFKYEMDFDVEIKLYNDYKRGQKFFQITSPFDEGHMVDKTIRALNKYLHPNAGKQSSMIHLPPPIHPSYFIQQPVLIQQHQPQKKQNPHYNNTNQRKNQQGYQYNQGYQHNRNYPQTKQQRPTMNQTFNGIRPPQRGPHTYTQPSYGIRSLQKTQQNISESGRDSPKRQQNQQNPQKYDEQAIAKVYLGFRGILEGKKLKKQFSTVKRYLQFAKNIGIMSFKFKLVYKNEITEVEEDEQQLIYQGILLGVTVIGNSRKSVYRSISYFKAFFELNKTTYEDQKQIVNNSQQIFTHYGEVRFTLNAQHVQKIQQCGYESLQLLIKGNKKCFGINLKMSVINNVEKFQIRGEQHPKQLILSGVCQGDLIKVAQQMKRWLQDLPIFGFRQVYPSQKPLQKLNKKMILECKQTFYMKSENSLKTMGDNFKNLLLLKERGMKEITIVINFEAKQNNIIPQWKFQGLDLHAETPHMMKQAFQFLEKCNQNQTQLFDLDRFFQKYDFQGGQIIHKKQFHQHPNLNQGISLISNISLDSEEKEQEEEAKRVLELWINSEESISDRDDDQNQDSLDLDPLFFAKQQGDQGYMVEVQQPLDNQGELENEHQNIDYEAQNAPKVQQCCSKEEKQKENSAGQNKESKQSAEGKTKINKFAQLMGKRKKLDTKEQNQIKKDGKEEIMMSMEDKKGISNPEIKS